MATKCIAQMPPPKATEASAIDAFFWNMGFSESPRVSDKPVKPATSATMQDIAIRKLLWVTSRKSMAQKMTKTWAFCKHWCQNARPTVASGR